MNILFISHFQKEGHIITPFIDAQIKGFVELGHNVMVLVPIPLGKRNNLTSRIGHGYEEKEIDGIKYAVVRYITASKYGEKTFNRKNCWKSVKKHLKKITEDFAPDVIYAHTIMLDGYVGVKMKEELGVPAVISTHGGDLVKPLEMGWRSYISGICSSADAVTANSNKMERILRSCDISSAISTILLGFDRTLIKTNTDKDEKKILQVSNLVKSKNTDITIKAFAMICDGDSDFSLTIVGDGPEKNNLVALVSELGLEEKVVFRGAVSHDEVIEEMGSAMYFVMPSSPEGFGVVYLEAMSQGCVTVGTKGEGIDGVIIDGENGFLVEPTDAQGIGNIIIDCDNNPDRRETIRKRASEDVSMLDWRHTCSEYIKLFESLVNQVGDQGGAIK